MLASVIAERDAMREQLRKLEERCAELKVMLAEALDREARLLADQQERGRLQ